MLEERGDRMKQVEINSSFQYYMTLSISFNYVYKNISTTLVIMLIPSFSTFNIRLDSHTIFRKINKNLQIINHDKNLQLTDSVYEPFVVVDRLSPVVETILLL